VVSGALVSPVATLDPRPVATIAARPGAEDDSWLAAFHRGDREVLSRCYQDYAGTVARAVRPLVSGFDQETVVHDMFCRLFGSADARRSFTGGNFRAWLTTVARRQAIDHRRRMGRERLIEEADLEQLATQDTGSNAEEELDLRVLVARFREHVLPPKWEPVFQVRFLEQLDQRAAARRLGIPRTTVAYRELRIRVLLKRFMLEEDP
jgi:RNA polymerase sigma-70 factor, ECF subfamily